ncbi:hypothetical protein DITRI_Ditri05aG0078400 [Diplodiscus trichospermus]
MSTSEISSEGVKNLSHKDSFVGSSSDAKDWRKLFVAAPDQELQFFLPGIFEEGETHWKYTIVVQFIGQVPKFSLFQRLVYIIWGSNGEVEIRPAGPNLFIIQLPNAATRDRILEQGPWHIQNKPLIVRK